MVFGGKIDNKCHSIFGNPCNWLVCINFNEGRGVNYVKIEKHIFISGKLCCTNDDNNWINFYSTKYY